VWAERTIHPMYPRKQRGHAWVCASVKMLYQSQRSMQVFFCGLNGQGTHFFWHAKQNKGNRTSNHRRHCLHGDVLCMWCVCACVALVFSLQRLEKKTPFCLPIERSSTLPISILWRLSKLSFICKLCPEYAF